MSLSWLPNAISMLRIVLVGPILLLAVNDRTLMGDGRLPGTGSSKGTATGLDQTDTLSNVENVQASDQDDTVVGSDANNRLEGRGGDDTIPTTSIVADTTTTTTTTAPPDTGG